MALDVRNLLTSLPKRLGTAGGYAPALIVSGALAFKTIRAILAKAGHPAVPLDDAFIHFQYARNLASGHFFTYAPGDSFTSGATSFVWPAALAFFHLIGFHDLSIIWPAWILGFIAHAALVVETWRLSSRLTGKHTAYGAAAMAALFGGFTWFAASGMETIPLSWIIARTARVASEWCEAAPGDRSKRRRNELIALGIVAPLIRPEGMLATGMACVALLSFAAGAAKGWRARSWGLMPLIGAAILPLLNLVMTGHAGTTTAQVKWLPLSPYYPTLATLWPPIRANIQLMFSTLLNGEQWSAIFIPKGSTPFAIAALIAIPIAGWRAARPWRAFFILVFALGIFLPCTYGSYLWNRLRYLWPFVPGWLVGFACLSRLVAEAAAQLHPRWISLGPIISGSVAGLLASFLSWTIDDVAQSASAIDRQQVTLGIWARDHLPADANIGVNDTGAIAYMSGKHTFDVVGLTTAGEARYWVAGAGSRFEHYERMGAGNPRLPNYFIVYPQWMSCDPVLGTELFEAAVYDQSILGGTRMVVYPRRSDLLGSGDKPVQVRSSGAFVDVLDVADLESEAEHAYEYFQPGNIETSNRVFQESADFDEPTIHAWADGGRFERLFDRFEAHLPAGAPVRGIARLVGAQSTGAMLTVSAGGKQVATLQLTAGHAMEAEFIIPAEVASPKTRIELQVLSGSFGSLHYWFETARP
ncbi:MAG: hypothetical protein HY898_35695 [Deltaproteobacteria bacterium]|nr:hypothetical protein [Deltaproteobacteria bacterium]